MIEYIILIGLTVVATLYCTNAKVRKSVHDLIANIKNARKDTNDDHQDGPPTGGVPVGTN